jgi:hypothetical protein
MTYIGIDFSLTSPSFCVKDGKSIHWGSLTRSDRTAESLRKSKDKPYFILNGIPNIDLFFLQKEEMPAEYSEKERVKIDYFQSVVDALWLKIEPFVTEDTQIAMEGLSFSSNGNALIDISMATALMRKKIVDRIGSQNFWVFPPTAIKKFAGKGNFKKDDMYLALVEIGKSSDSDLCEFSKRLSDHSDSWITKSKAVNKPVDDLVDATWICLLLEDNLREK